MAADRTLILRIIRLDDLAAEWGVTTPGGITCQYCGDRATTLIDARDALTGETRHRDIVCDACAGELTPPDASSLN